MGEKVTITFLSIAFVTIFAYWTYVIMYPLYTLASFASEVFNPSHWGVGGYAEISAISVTSVRTIRQSIIFYGFYLFNLAFGLILLYRLLHRAKSRRVETYSYTLFLFLCGSMGFLSIYWIAGGVFPDRFLMFGWLFGFVPLVVAILKGKYKWPKRVGVFLLVAFMFFNLYTIPTTAWDARAEGVPSVPSENDYALANTFDFSSGRIFGALNIVMAIYDVHNNFGTGWRGATFRAREYNLTEFDWVVIQKEELEFEKKYYPEPRTETIAGLERFATECPTDYIKIYDSNSLLVFKLRQ